jgi:hypothetical protein
MKDDVEEVVVVDEDGNVVEGSHRKSKTCVRGLDEDEGGEDDDEDEG